MSNKEKQRAIVIYDGECGFCQRNVSWLKKQDKCSQLDFVDYHQCQDVSALHGDLTLVAVQSQIHVIDSEGHLFGGFFALRALSRVMASLSFLRIILFSLAVIFSDQSYTVGLPETEGNGQALKTARKNIALSLR